MNRIQQITAGIGLALTAVLLLTGLPASARAPYFDWTFDPVAFDPPQPVRFELDNGLIVYFLADDELPVITMTAMVRTGEVYAPAAKTGLGEITGEALVTGGTESRTPDEVDEALEFLGIDWNGSIGDESGSFAMRCLAKDFPTALDLFADLLQRPRFDDAKLRLALDNAKETLRRQNDSPRRIISREFARLLYGDHPYGRFPTETTLDAITRDDVAAFYRRDVHPNTTILAISGSIGEADLRQAVGGAFGGWARTAVELPAIPDLPQPQTGYFQINKDISQTNIRFGHVGIDRHDPDRHAIRVLNHILGGGGFTSRMVETVRSDSGLAYSVGTDFSLANQPGMFYAACQTKSDGTAKTLALMQWVIADLLKEGITENELATAKESILNSDVFKYVTPVGIVERYAWLEYYGFPADQLKQDVAAIGAVTAADVEAAARKHLHPDNYTVLAVGPIAEFEAPLAPAGNVKTLEIE